MADDKILTLVITAREKDLGGFTVRRMLPYATHRMVGPFIFFDHMGPADFAPGQGLSVRPHPHVNLATVTYLFEGVIHHRDSLGSDQLIEPGAVNAGRGIVHSERTPAARLASGGRVNGIQLWVALPREFEEGDPTFSHHPKDTLPEFEVDGAGVKLLLGAAFGRRSPVPVHSDLFYAEVTLRAGERLTVPTEGRETALYVVDGSIAINEETVPTHAMAVARVGVDLPLRAKTDSRVMVIGGSPVGERFIYWNFVSSSKERLEEAKRAWANGPGEPRFPFIPGDAAEFIPLPTEPGQPKGTIM